MKRVFLLVPIFLLCLTHITKAQTNNTAPDTADYPYWIAMMQDESANFFTVQRAFNAYYQKHHDEKTEEEMESEGEEAEEGFALYKRWEYMMLRRINPDGTRRAPDQNYSALINYMSNRISPNGVRGGATFPGASNPSGDWTSLGPGSLPKNTLGQPNGMGRVNAIAFDPAKKGTIYVGAPSGGLWVTTDSGTTWSTKTDGLATLGVSSIAIDPTTSSTIYLGTGDRDHYDAPGISVLKSTNSGSTWSAANSGMGTSSIVSKLLINPSNATILLAATSSGIWRSTNSAGSWKQTSSNGNFYKDMVFKPHNPNIVYATENGNFYRSLNGGSTWTQITSGLSSAYRGVIAVTPADTNRVYFITTGTNTFSACYISTDGGKTFRTKSTSPNIMDYSDNGSGSQGQSFYDLCVAADTAKAGTLYVGGINVFKSTDSGSTWSCVAHWVGSGLPVIHADQHVFAINPLNNKLFVGNDGGIYWTSNGGTSWKDISSGLGIGQIYKIGQSATRQDLMLSGFQDNGTASLNNGRWSSIIGGDGMECAVDAKDTTYQYGEIYYGDIYRSTDAGKTFYDHVAGNGTASITEAGDWVTPYVISKTNNSVMFGGYANIWRCSNIKASSPSWTKISNSLAGSNTDLVEVTEQSAADSNTFYFSRNDDRLFLSANINATTPTWTDLTSSLPNSGSLVVEVKTHPKYANVVYIIQDEEVYVSKDKGSTWTNITGTLPGVAKNTIAIDKNSYSGLYIGTDVGVFYRDSSMSDWTPFATGLPASARIMELEIYYDAAKSSNNKIKAGSFGRGAWQSDLYSPVTPVAKFFINTSNQCLTGNAFSFTDSTKISSGTITTWLWDFGDGSATSAVQYPKHTYTKAGTFTVKLIATSSLGTSDNTSNTVTVYPQSTPSFTVNSSTQCLTSNSFVFTDKSAIFTGSITSWAWDFGDLKTSTTQSPTHAYTNAGTYKVVLKTTSNNGCTDTVSKSVTVYPQSTPGFVVNTSSQCLTGNSFVFTDKTTITGGSIATWAWDFGDLGTSATQNPTHVYAAAGTYTVKLKITTNKGCTDNTSSSVTVYPQSTVNYTINTTVQCLRSNSYVFTDKSSVASGSIATWNWDFGDGNTSTKQNPTYFYSAAGTYKVQLKVTTNNGCIDTITKPMNVFPQPAAGFTIANAGLCLAGNNFSFTDASTVSSGSLGTWAWDFGDGNTASTQNATHAYASPGTYTVQLKVATGFGCNDSTSKTVTVFPQAVPVFKVNSLSQCYSGNSFSITDKSTVSSGAVSGWAWDFGDGTSTFAQNPVKKYAKPGVYTLKLKTTTDKGCNDTTSQIVTVFPQPVSSFSIAKTAQCLAGNSFSFTDKSTIATGTFTKWAWNFGDGTNSPLQNPLHTYSKAGTFNIKLKVTTASGCQDSTTQSVTVYPQPLAAFGVDRAKQCLAGNIFKLSDSSTVSSGSLSTWAWSYGDGNGTGTENASHSYATAGTNTIQLKITSANGCQDSLSKAITVYPMPAPAITGTSQACSGTSSSYLTPKDSGSSYQWNVTGGTVTSGAGTQSIAVSWPKFTSATIWVVETNFEGCSDSATQNVLVNPSPVAGIKQLKPTCATSPVALKDSSTSATTYAWNFGDSASSATDTSSTQNPGHTYNTAGKYTVKLKVTGFGGCADSVKSTIVINPLPSTSWKLSYGSHSTAFHTLDSSLSDPSYSWDFGDGGNATGHSPTHIFATNKAYTVKLHVTNTYGCSKELDSLVNIAVSGVETFENPDISLTIFPNPFHESTTIKYSLTKSTKVRIVLYDVAGKEIGSITNAQQAEGSYECQVNAEKMGLVPGTYLIKIYLNDAFVSRHLVKW